MTIVTFGVFSSTFVANMAVIQNAANFVLEYHLAIKTVNNAFYVDDCLTGGDSIEEGGLMAPRHIALPLKPKVKKELSRMEFLGVISKVNKPTQWCAGIVVVPKKVGAIRICVDLKPLNDDVFREVHPLPKLKTHWLN